MRRLRAIRWALLVFAVQLGGCRARGVEEASTGEVTNPDEGPTTTGLDKALSQQLRRTGLLATDLATHTLTSTAYREFRDAVRARDAATARGAHARLMQRLGRVADDPALPARKLDRVWAQLETQRAALPPARVRALEAHLERLGDRLSAPTPDRRAINIALSTVERQLDRP